MAQYIKMSSLTSGSYNWNLKKAVIYIGKRYNKFTKKKKRTDDEYFKYGIKLVSKPFGCLRKGAVLCLVKPKKNRNSINKQWWFHKKIYIKAYGYILKLLKKLLRKDVFEDKKYTITLLNSLYQDISGSLGSDSNLARTYSNALIFWQKDMLELYRINARFSENDRKDAGKILLKIKELDIRYPFPSDS